MRKLKPKRKVPNTLRDEEQMHKSIRAFMGLNHPLCDNQLVLAYVKSLLSRCLLSPLMSLSLVLMGFFICFSDLPTRLLISGKLFLSSQPVEDSAVPWWLQLVVRIRSSDSSYISGQRSKTKQNKETPFSQLHQEKGCVWPPKRVLYLSYEISIKCVFSFRIKIICVLNLFGVGLACTKKSIPF